MKKAILLVLAALAAASAQAGTLERKIIERDMDGDGRKESKIVYEGEFIVLVQIDKNGDKRIDNNIYYENGDPHRGEKDRNFDGKIDTWTKYDADGNVTEVARDRSRKDGKPDYWIFVSQGSAVRREWDRNFDGKPDFRLKEERGRFLEKEYDDNFDGRYERAVKAPLPGESGRAVTTAPGR